MTCPLFAILIGSEDNAGLSRAASGLN